MPRKKQELPKMPRGQGSFSWENDEHTKIRFQKSYKTKADGKTYRLTVIGSTVNECFEAMDRKQEEKEKQVLKEEQEYVESMDSPIATLDNAMREWLKLTKYRSRKATAYDRNEVTLEQQIARHRLGKTRICDIKSKDIIKHLNYLQYEVKRHGGKTGYSFSTVKKTYDLLNQFFAYYYSSDMNSNPMNLVDPPKKESNVGELSLEEAEEVVMEDVVLSDEEIETFRRFTFREPLSGSVGRSKHGVALFFIMMTCLRVGEAVTVTWADIDLDNKLMRINKTTSRVKNRTGDGKGKTRLIITKPKTANAVRNVALSDSAVEALLLIKKRSGYTGENDFVLSTDTGERLTEQQLYSTLKGVLKGAKLNTPAREKTFGVHYLRHTGISYYLRHGIPVELVSRMAGHSGVDITLKTYYHIISDQNSQLLDLMNGISGAKKGES